MPSSSVPELLVLVEVAGCPTTCMHCWALGGNYGAMPLADAAFVLEQLERFCRDRALSYAAYPMHEVTAHPEAPAVIRLFFSDPEMPYDPILTPGTPLASRQDWDDVIRAARECGAHALWVAFHGFGGEHDRQLNRPGAFDETCLAVRRAQESGLSTGANVFLTRPSLREFDRLLDTLRELRLDDVAIGPARYTPTARGRRYEALRPELADLLPLAEGVLELSEFHWDAWRNLAAFTEAAWTRQALMGAWPPSDRACQPSHNLVCRPNLDLYTGTTGGYRTRHGNLRLDDAQAVLERALAHGPVTEEAIYFPGPSMSTATLAASHGNPGGQRIYFEPASLRYRWLDQASPNPR
jgi:hypothetical protein